MKKKHAILLILGLFTNGTWLGCDENGNVTENISVPSNVSPEVYVEKLAEAACDALNRCCSPPEEFKQKCRQGVVEGQAEELESIKNGRTTFDTTAAAACITGLSTGYKDCVLSEKEVGDNCDKTLVGTGKDGDPCEADYHCAPGLECFQSLSDGKAHCSTFAGAGESCKNKTCDRGKGMACSRVPNSADQICAKAAALGESCKNIECADGLYCNSKANPPTCAAQLAEGAACESHDQCQSITCSKGACAVEGSICPAFGADSAPQRMRRRLLPPLRG